MHPEGGVRNLGKPRALLLVLVLAASIWTVVGSSAPAAGLAIETRSVGLTNPLALEPHDPIHITGNGGFNTSNAVRIGPGNAAGPNITSDWPREGEPNDDPSGQRQRPRLDLWDQRGPEYPRDFHRGQSHQCCEPSVHHDRHSFERLLCE